MQKTLVGAVVFVGLVSAIQAETELVPAVRDTTLIEESSGAAANGAGPAVFAGRNASGDNSVRRGLLVFDLTQGSLRPQANGMDIESVALVVTNLTESNLSPAEFRLHRLLADWGEGTSSSTGGVGAESTPGDATWIHAFFPDAFWLHNGAQFVGAPSAHLTVAGPGTYRFEGDALLRDVRRWLQHPERNFGWILIGDETRGQTARAFASREAPNPAVRPRLEITLRRRP